MGRRRGSLRPILVATFTVLLFAGGGAAYNIVPRVVNPSSPFSLRPIQSVTQPTTAQTGGPNWLPQGPFDGHYFLSRTTGPIGASAYSFYAAYDPSTHIEFTSNYLAGTVTALQVQNGTIQASRWLGVDTWGSTQGIAYDARDNRLFVGVSGPSGQNGSVFVLDAASLDVLANISLTGGAFAPFAPSQVVWDSSTDRVFLLNQTNGVFAGLEASNSSILGFFSCGVPGCGSASLAVLPGQGSMAQTTLNDTIVIHSTSHPANPPGVAVLPAGFLSRNAVWDSALERLLVTNSSSSFSNPIEEVNVSSLSDSGAFASGPRGPIALAYDSASNSVLVADENSSQELFAFDGSSGAQIGHRNASSFAGVSYFFDLKVDPVLGLVITDGAINNTTFAFQLPGLSLVHAYAAAPFESVLIGVVPSTGTAFEVSFYPDGVFAVPEAGGPPSWFLPVKPAALVYPAFALDGQHNLLFVPGRSLLGYSITEVNASSGASGLSVSFGVGATLISATVDSAARLLFVGVSTVSGYQVQSYSYSTGLILQGSVSIPGTSPCFLATDPAAHRLFVTNCGSPLGNITQVNESNLTVQQVYLVGNFPEGIVVDPTGLVYVLNRVSRNVTVLQPSTLARLGSFSLGNFHPAGGAIDPIDGLLFLSDFSTNAVAIYSTATDAFVGNVWPVPVGFGVAYDPQTQTILDGAVFAGELVEVQRATVPSPPTSLLIQPENSTLNLSWAAGAGGTPAFSYNVSISTNASGPWVLEGSATSPSFSVTNLTDGTTYFVEVAAENFVGTSLSLQGSGTPRGVSYPPDQVAAAATGSSSIRVTWNSPVSDDGAPIANYTILFRVGGTSSWQSLSVGTELQSTLSGLTPSTRYQIEVVAWNSVGPSNPGGNLTVATATPPSGLFGQAASGVAWLALVVVLLLAALGGVLLWRRRRQRNLPTPSPPEPVPPPAPPAPTLPPAWSEGEAPPKTGAP